jgi:hypothetical protein
MIIMIMIMMIIDDYNNDNNNDNDNDNDNDDDNDDNDDDDDDDELDYSSENEKELENRPISEDFSNLNETTFIIKLLKTVRNITIRTLLYARIIIWEELADLFHPILG